MQKRDNIVTQELSQGQNATQINPSVTCSNFRGFVADVNEDNAIENLLRGIRDKDTCATVIRKHFR